MCYGAVTFCNSDFMLEHVCNFLLVIYRIAP